MTFRTRYRINLLESERRALEELIRKQTTGQHIAKRARIILMANGEGETNQNIADRLGIYKAMSALSVGPSYPYDRQREISEDSSCVPKISIAGYRRLAN